MQLNLNYEPKEIFNFKEYQESIQKKIVRHGEDRTGTLLDFISKEDQAKLTSDDVSHLDPSPKDIKDHIDFAINTLFDLTEKYPNDPYIDSLNNDPTMKAILFSFDWYKKYGIDETIYVYK